MKRKFICTIMLLGMLAAGFMTSAARAQDAAARRIVVVVKRFSYDPAEITLKKGQPVVLVLKSADVAHGLRFRKLNIDLKVKAHGTAEVQFTPEQTGDFVGRCSVFCGSGHGALKLEMHVVE